MRVFPRGVLALVLAFCFFCDVNAGLRPLESYDVAYWCVKKLPTSKRKITITSEKTRAFKNKDAVDVADDCRSEVIKELEGFIEELRKWLELDHAKKSVSATVSLIDGDAVLIFSIECVLAKDEVGDEDRVTAKVIVQGLGGREPNGLRSIIEGLLESKVERKQESGAGGFLSLCAIVGVVGAYKIGYLDEPIKKLKDLLGGEESLDFNVSVDCDKISKGIAQVYEDQRDLHESFSSIVGPFGKIERPVLFDQRDVIVCSLGNTSLFEYEAQAKEFWEQFGSFKKPASDDDIPVFESNLKYKSSFIVVIPLSLLVARWRVAERLMHQNKPANSASSARRGAPSADHANVALKIGRLPLTCVVDGRVYEPLFWMTTRSHATIVVVDDLKSTTISCRYVKDGASLTKRDFIKKCFKDDLDPALVGFGGQCNVAYFSEADDWCTVFHFQKFGFMQKLKRALFCREFSMNGQKIEDFVSFLKSTGWVF